MTIQEAQEIFEQILQNWTVSFHKSFGNSLKSIVRFGSTVRPPLKYDTDIDVLIIFEELPKSRRARFKLIDHLEKELMSELKQRLPDYNFSFSPIIRSSKDLEIFSPLYLDMVDHSVVHFDPENLMKCVLERTQQWIKKSGAKKIHRGLKWYWDLNFNGSITKIEW